ncbi:MAG: helix-turn-helix domain containing protein [Chloroflexi bacterium]|nr:helix-turn-helix domain containing protein [Chloroflexota bacterium]
MALYVRTLTGEDQRRLEGLARSAMDGELSKRARIVLLSARRQRVHEISAAVELHPINVRKWIHRFNRLGIEGLYPRRSPGRPRLFDEDQREAIVALATSEPDALGLDFEVWSLQRLRSQLIRRGVMPEISAETIRQELLRGGLVFEGRRWVRQNGMD